MARGILTVASRKRLEKRKRLTPFRRDSRVIDQFKPSHWDAFCEWANKYRKMLGLSDDDDPSELTYIRFNYHQHARHSADDFNKSKVYLALAELIKAVGGSEGFKYNKMVFFRYISSPEHSNLRIDYKSLKRQLQSMF